MDCRLRMAERMKRKKKKERYEFLGNTEKLMNLVDL